MTTRANKLSDLGYRGMAMWRWVLTISMIMFPQLLLAQSSQAPSAGAFLPAILELYTRFGQALVGGIVTLLGLPVAYITFKKLNADFIKTTLETQRLRQDIAQQDSSLALRSISEAQQIIIRDSDGASVQILADPRLLGPLLLILNFIIAFVFLTIISHLLAMFDVANGIIMAAVSAALLLPLVGQAMRISSSFKSSLTAGELAAYAATIKRTRKIVLLIYSIIMAAAAFVGGAILLVANVTPLGTAFGWALLAVGLIGMAIIRYFRSVLNKIIPDM